MPEPAEPTANPSIPQRVSGRIERFFGRVGLIATALGLLLLVLAIDVLLTKQPSRLGVTPSEDFSMVTRDGRELGWSFAGLRLRFTPVTLYENEPGQESELYRINSHGLRGGEVAADPEGERVLILGGSAAFGMGVAEQQTFPHLLTGLIEGEALNGGVVGYLSSQETALALFRLLDLEPDVLLAFNGWNDLYDPYWWTIYGPGRPSVPGTSVQFELIENRLLELRGIEHQPSRALRAGALSVLRGSTILSTLSELLVSPSPPEERPIPGDLLQTVVETYVANMTRLHDVARARGGRLLVVLQPAQGQLLDEASRARLREERGSFDQFDRYWHHFPELYGEFREQVGAALRERGVDFIDGSTLFPQDPRVAGRLFNDPVHLSPEGHRVMALALARELGERRLKRDPPAR